MKQLPEIVVYAQTGTPLRGAEFVSRFWQDGEFLPMIFSGNSAWAADRAAREFWSTETAKIEAKRGQVAKINGAN